MHIVQAAKMHDPEIMREEQAKMAAKTDAKEEEKNVFKKKFFKKNFFKKDTHEAAGTRTSDLEVGSEMSETRTYCSAVI